MTMEKMKYSDRIITDAVPMPPEVTQNHGADLQNLKHIKSTHLMNVDARRLKDFFYVDCYWLWQGASDTKVETPHTHNFDEVIGFVGTNENDPYDLGGEITIWLDNDETILKRTSLIFIPAGTSHCPIQFNRIERPIFYVIISPKGIYSRSAVGDSAVSTSPKKGDNPRYTIISHTKEQFGGAADKAGPPPPPKSDIRGSRVLHLEDDMASGAFYLDFVWIYEGNGGAPAPQHNHEWPELIAMAGCDPEHPHDLGGKMTIDLEGDVYEMTKSSLVCIPAGVNHCPWKFINITKPTLVFTAGPSAMYSGSHRKDA
jgi:mannose-6-phosphate isomerase-like protein (cupin superfamily)